MIDTASDTNALNRAFPALAGTLPYAELGEFPTPLETSEAGAEFLGCRAFSVKRDDKSSSIYGGNKVRKLEYLVADAQRVGARSMITFGALGSNHLLATSIHAGRSGLHAVGLLVPQPVSEHMKRNLLLNLHYGTELVFVPSQAAQIPMSFYTIARKRKEDGVKPYVVPHGGSSAMGAVGYVNAAFELREQIAASGAPEPDLIFVACGSNGTAAGLILGCRAAGLRSRIVPIVVSTPLYCNRFTLAALCRKTNQLLRDRDSSFPDCGVRPDDIYVSIRHIGPEYALYTPDSVEAVRNAERLAQIKIEGTYTGKAFAGMTHFCRRNRVADKNILFWNTYNSVDLSHLAAGVDPQQLPPDFRRYYHMPNQPLEYET